MQLTRNLSCQMLFATVCLEMASTFGWQKYVGLDGVTVGIDGFGASGPADQVMAQFGFTVENVVARYLEAFGK